MKNIKQSVCRCTALYCNFSFKYLFFSILFSCGYAISHIQMVFTCLSSSTKSGLQNGFRKAHSTQHALFRLIQKWQTELDSGGYVGTILMDLPKHITVYHMIY